MPDILKFRGKKWQLTVWTRDNDSPRELLRSVLSDRRTEVPTEEVCFSFLLDGDESAFFEEHKLSAASGTSAFKIPSPLCYENRDYEFEFRFADSFFTDKEKPVIHRLTEIENSFRATDQRTARGTVNFKNNIGWFKLGIRYCDKKKEYRDFVAFKVFPTKIDMESDLDIILDTIDSCYPLWRFSLAQKTDVVLSRTNKPHDAFELLWLAQFKSLAEELIDAVKLICRSPHSRLLPDIKKIKAERIAGKISGKLEERIKENLLSRQYHKRYRIEKRKLSYDTPENRFVKMVLLYSVKRLKLFSARIREVDQVPENVRLSESFFNEIRELFSPFETLSSDPLFREIGNYDGHMRESLVLHQRAGYAKVYRIWQELKLYLDYFGSDAAISVRSVEQLYEVWCLLEIRELLLKLGFQEGRESLRPLKTVGIEKGFDKKHDEIFVLFRSDGVKALLVHEPSYSCKKGKKFDRIYSWTTTQRPDIFLEITMPAGDKLRWVFDAKYRIDSNDGKEWPQKGVDTVPDDAINQMHRYRDSLIYISEAPEDGETDKIRPVIGAFALYPGWFNQELSANPYKESIETVGIGAFPLLPGQKNKWLFGFLKDQIGELRGQPGYKPVADEIYLNGALRVSNYGMRQYHYDDLILTADIFKTTPREYVRGFKEGTAGWYHVPVNTINNYKISRHVMREIKYCAFTVLENHNRVCRYIYPVEKVVCKVRSEIDDYAGGKSKRDAGAMYWLIKLGKSISIPQEMKSAKRARNDNTWLKLLSFKDFMATESWAELSSKYVYTHIGRGRV